MSYLQWCCESCRQNNENSEDWREYLHTDGMKILHGDDVSDFPLVQVKANYAISEADVNKTKSYFHWLLDILPLSNNIISYSGIFF